MAIGATSPSWEHRVHSMIKEPVPSLAGKIDPMQTGPARGAFQLAICLFSQSLGEAKTVSASS